MGRLEMNNYEFDRFFEELSFEQILELFRRLSNTDRMGVFEHFCPYCGDDCDLGECGCAALFE